VKSDEISVGYRVNSHRGIEFRKWASKRLKEYLIEGVAINEKRSIPSLPPFQKRIVFFEERIFVAQFLRFLGHLLVRRTELHEEIMR
jgi:hypothetical protein